MTTNHKYGPAGRLLHLGAFCFFAFGMFIAAFHAYENNIGGVFVGALFGGAGLGFLCCPCRIVKRGDRP